MVDAMANAYSTRGREMKCIHLEVPGVDMRMYQNPS
jgi:hypothetical protein